MPYEPSPVPSVPGLPEYLARELRRIGVQIKGLEVSVADAGTGTISGSATINLTHDFVTYSDETASLVNSRRLAAGTNVNFGYSITGQVVLNVTIPPSDVSLGGLSLLTLDDETGTAPDSLRLIAGDGIEISRSATVRISAPGGGGGDGISLDELQVEPLVRNEVIVNYWPGIAVGTVSAGDISAGERITNGIAFQECIDYCVAHRYRLRMVRGTFEINLAGGLLIRTIGVDNITGEAVPVGTVGSTTTAPTGFTWEALLNCEIHQFASNTPILTIGTTDTFGINFYGCTLHYGQDEQLNTESNALVLGPLWLCRIGGLRVANTTTNNKNYRALYQPQDSFFFSNHLYDIKLFKSVYSLLEIQSVGTGNLFNNVYISAVSSSGSASACQFPLRYQGPSFGQAHGNIFNQFNIEWCIATQLMQIANIRGITFNGVHLERNRLSGSNACFLLPNITDINFNGLMALDNEWSLATGNPCWIRPVNDCGVLINGMSFRVNSSAYVDRDVFMVYQGDTSGWDNTPCKVTINNFKSQDTGSTVAQRLKFDRTVDIAGHGPLGLMGAQQIFSCPEPGSTMRGAEFSRNYASVLYGALAEDAFMKYPGSMSSTLTLGLSRYMGPAGTRHAGVPVKRGMSFGLRRSAGTGAGALVVMGIEDERTLTVMTTGAQTLRFTFDGAAWQIGGLKGSSSQMVRYAASSTSIGDSDDMIVANATDGALTVTLPSLQLGRPVMVKKSDATGNVVIVDGFSGDTIDGALAVTLSSQHATMYAVGGQSDWHRIR